MTSLSNHHDSNISQNNHNIKTINNLFSISTKSFKNSYTKESRLKNPNASYFNKNNYYMSNILNNFGNSDWNNEKSSTNMNLTNNLKFLDPGLSMHSPHQNCLINYLSENLEKESQKTIKTLQDEIKKTKDLIVKSKNVIHQLKIEINTKTNQCNELTKLLIIEPQMSYNSILYDRDTFHNKNNQKRKGKIEFTLPHSITYIQKNSVNIQNNFRNNKIVLLRSGSIESKNDLDSNFIEFHFSPTNKKNEKKKVNIFSEMNIKGATGSEFNLNQKCKREQILKMNYQQNCNSIEKKVGLSNQINKKIIKKARSSLASITNNLNPNIGIKNRLVSKKQIEQKMASHKRLIENIKFLEEKLKNSLKNDKIFITKIIENITSLKS